MVPLFSINTQMVTIIDVFAKLINFIKIVISLPHVGTYF